MRFGVYVYVDGSDLHDVAVSSRRGLGEIAGRYPQLTVIDDRFERTPDLRPDDLPTWNLGLSFDLGQDRGGFVRGVIECFRSLSRESGRSFAVGYYDRISEIGEDIGYIEPEAEGDDIVGVLESLATNA